MDPLKQTQSEMETKLPANDNGSGHIELVDPRIIRIAQAIGRQIARQQTYGRNRTAANDNSK